MNEPNGMDKLCMKVFQSGDSESIPQSFEERFDEWKSKYPTGNDLADVVGASDDMFVSISDLEAFIRQEKELSRKEGLKARCISMDKEFVEALKKDSTLQPFLDEIKELSRKEERKLIVEMVENSFNGEELLYGSWLEIIQKINQEDK